MKKWKCAVCGYVADAEAAPNQCPKCGAPKEQFVVLDDAAANLIQRSRNTNALHCRLVSLTRELEAVCKDGVQDNLDAGCVDVFTKSLAQAYNLMKLSMTEMAGHVGKHKWG